MSCRSGEIILVCISAVCTSMERIASLIARSLCYYVIILMTRCRYLLCIAFITFCASVCNNSVLCASCFFCYLSCEIVRYYNIRLISRATVNNICAVCSSDIVEYLLVCDLISRNSCLVNRACGISHINRLPTVGRLIFIVKRCSRNLNIIRNISRYSYSLVWRQSFHRGVYNNRWLTL